VRGDQATFASDISERTLLKLGGGGLGSPVLPHARRYRIVDISDQGDGSGESSVEFVGAGRYVLVTRWRRADGAWRGVDAEIPAESMRAPWWRRMLGQGPKPAPPVERKDLS
jgi:hypothetical protein